MKLYSRRDAAKMLGVCVRTVLTLTQRGELPCVRVSPRRVLYADSTIKAFVAKKMESR